MRVLRSAPPDHQCFSFLPAPTPLTMWARRQASEIAIHRFDAEVARGLATTFDADFAADMLDELLSGFAPRDGDPERPIERERVLHVHATDVDRHWYLTFGDHGIKTSDTGDRVDLTATATAHDLYLLMWNRTADTTAELAGDAALMQWWRSDCRVRWSGGE